MVAQIRTAQWVDQAHTAARCVVFAESLGDWVPYTATAAEAAVDDFARDVWSALASFPVQEYAPEPASTREARARNVRNAYIQESDVFMLPDYPITPERRQVIMDYRAYLRALPESGEYWYDRHIKTREEWEREHEPQAEVNANEQE